MTIHFSDQKKHLKSILIGSKDLTKTNESSSLMNLLLKENVPVASSCHGDGICGKCRVKIIAGFENLNPESELEIKTKSKNKISNSERLSCQTFLMGDVTIDTNYW